MWKVLREVLKQMRKWSIMLSNKYRITRMEVDSQNEICVRELKFQSFHSGIVLNLFSWYFFDLTMYVLDRDFCLLHDNVELTIERNSLPRLVEHY